MAQAQGIIGFVLVDGDPVDHYFGQPQSRADHLATPLSGLVEVCHYCQMKFLLNPVGDLIEPDGHSVACREFDRNRDFSIGFELVPNILADYRHASLKVASDLREELRRIKQCRADLGITCVIGVHRFRDFARVYFELPAALRPRRSVIIPWLDADTYSAAVTELWKAHPHASSNGKRVIYAGISNPDKCKLDEMNRLSIGLRCAEIGAFVYLRADVQPGSHADGLAARELLRSLKGEPRLVCAMGEPYVLRDGGETYYLSVSSLEQFYVASAEVMETLPFRP